LYGFIPALGKRQSGGVESMAWKKKEQGNKKIRSGSGLVARGVTDGARTRDIQSHNLDLPDFVD